MATQWKCPKADCPPTDFAPAEATSFDDDVPMAVCGGDCGAAYPVGSFKRVPASMSYAGAQRDVYGTVTRGDGTIVRVPVVSRSIRGEAVGDFGVIDDEAVEWNGAEWVASTWEQL